MRPVRGRSRRRGYGFEPRGDVNAIAKDIVIFDDDVAEINPDPEFNPPLLSEGGLARGDRPLHRDSTAYRVDDAGELDEHAVAGGLKDTAAVFGNRRIDQFAA